MSLKSYHQLINTLCEFARLSDPTSMYEVANISVSDINFSMLYKKNPPHGDVEIYCGFGPLPEQQCEPVLLRLLETNLFLCTGPGTPTLAYNPETNQVVLVCSFSLDVIEARELMNILEHLAQVAKQWQSNYFLDNEGAEAQMQSYQSVLTSRNLNTAATQR